MGKSFCATDKKNGRSFTFNTRSLLMLLCCTASFHSLAYSVSLDEELTTNSSTHQHLHTPTATNITENSHQHKCSKHIHDHGEVALTLPMSSRSRAWQGACLSGRTQQCHRKNRYLLYKGIKGDDKGSECIYLREQEPTFHRCSITWLKSITCSLLKKYIYILYSHQC